MDPPTIPIRFRSDVPNFYDSSPGAYIPYLGDGSTAFRVNFTEPTDISRLFSVTGWNDQFGLFDMATGEKFALFRAWDTIGLTTTFFAPGTYGFYLVNGNGQTWYSTTLDGGRSHFVVFQGEDHWYLGVEVATFTTPRPADWDCAASFPARRRVHALIPATRSRRRW